ncbi:MAG: thiamine phosphate synthase [Pseudomonadota bacterium]
MMRLKHQADAARKWRTAIRQVEYHFPSHLPPLMFLTDPDRAPDAVFRLAELPEKAGIIFRHFGASDRFARAKALADHCLRQRRPFLIAADPELALSVGATGVHWPESWLGAARKWRGRFYIQTASAHSRRAAVRAAQMGMDAVFYSAIFPSDSPSAGQPVGPTKFRLFELHAPLPVYGLGGVNSRTAARIASHSGLSGVSLW